MPKYVALFTLLIAMSNHAQAAVKRIDLISENETLFSLKDGKKVLIFMSSKCPCSNSHTKYLTELAGNQTYKEFKFYGIHSNKNESIDRAKKYFAGKNLGFPVLSDKDQILANELGALKTPHAYIVDNGKIVYQGGVVNSRTPKRENLKHYLKNALNDLIAGNSPRVKETRALGCRIGR